jgi:hypothetical protein
MRAGVKACRGLVLNSKSFSTHATDSAPRVSPVTPEILIARAFRRINPATLAAFVPIRQAG